jgi:hypothetical protein
MTANIFSVLSILAIVAGGLISAFSARNPTRLTSWMSAYLVLVAGLVQFGLITIWAGLGSPSGGIMLMALLAYNLGNIGVLAGTMEKARAAYYVRLVDLGGILLALALILMLWAVRQSGFSWTMAEFVALVLIILISMPIGLVLSHRRRA